MTTGRNDACPCGSGKKYKKCCLGKQDTQGPAIQSSAYGRCSLCDSIATTMRQCKVCGKRYQHCAACAGRASVMINGHIMRVHPESVPLARLRNDPARLADMRKMAMDDPDSWRAFLDVLDGTVTEPHADVSVRGDGDMSFRDVGPCHRPKDIAFLMRREVAPGAVVEGQSGGWTLCLSRDDSVMGWFLSAKLVTPDFSSETDWQYLGQIVGAFGVPKKAFLEAMGSVKDTPGSTHRFMWREEEAE